MQFLLDIERLGLALEPDRHHINTQLFMSNLSGFVFGSVLPSCGKQDPSLTTIFFQKCCTQPVISSNEPPQCAIARPALKLKYVVLLRGNHATFQIDIRAAWLVRIEIGETPLLLKGNQKIAGWLGHDS